MTRYFGYEGMMNIREGQASNSFLSTETFLNFRVSSGGKSYTFEEPVYFSTLGNHTFEGSYQIGTNVFQVNVTDFIPNPKEQLTEQPNGQSVMKVVVAGKQGREEIFVKKGDKVNINGVNFNFTEELLPNAFNVTVRNDSLYFSTDAPVIQTVMATQKTDTIPASDYMPLKLKSMYVLGGSGFVIGDFKPSASMSIVAGDQKMKNESPAGTVTLSDAASTVHDSLFSVVVMSPVVGSSSISVYTSTQVAPIVVCAAVSSTRSLRGW